MRVAIIHDWLVNQRGGEHVLDAVCELFPKAELFTLVYEPGKVSDNIIMLKRHVSLLQKIPNATKRYRHMLPLMPFAIERFNLKGFDLIISSSHCVAKGVVRPEGAFHMSYVHAPMRYMWDRFDEYFGPGRYGLPTRLAARAFRSYLQNWDRKSAAQVDHFVANSKFIAGKIEQFYGRKADVVYPFADLEFFMSVPRKAGRNYVMVTALVPYKRVDVAIDAFNRMRKDLIIVGDGPDRHRLEKIAGPTVQIVGGVKRASLADFYAKSKALIFPGIEDFGIVPVEAMASGAPVIALGQGGLLETVTEKTGLFYNDGSVEGLIDAVERFEAKTFNADDCRARAREFSRSRFQREFIEQLAKHAPQNIVDNLPAVVEGAK